MVEASVGHQCPECVAEGRRTQRQARTPFGAAMGSGQRGVATISLIIVNVLMLLASAVSAHNGVDALYGGQWGGLLGRDTPLLDQLGVVGQCMVTATGEIVPCGVADGQYYRLLTAMFMHVGAVHLLLNMLLLWQLGRMLEDDFGPVRFLAIYLVCGIGGDVAVYLFSPGSGAAGASGAIFGLFAVQLVALRRLNRDTSAVIPIIVINLFFTISVPNISIAGHLGGLATGAVVGAGMAYAPQENRTAFQALALIGTLGLLGALTLWQTLQLT
jgi:membrane associated rhomboid family serine protease